MRSIDLAAPDRAEVIRADFDRIADADPAVRPRWRWTLAWRRPETA